MIASRLINDTVPPLKVSDTGMKALKWMGEFFVQHLPVIDKQKLVGIVSEHDVLDMEDPNQALSAAGFSVPKVAVHSTEHIYEVIKRMSESGLSVMPIIDEEGNYDGLITSNSLLDYFASASSVRDPGGIIILHVMAQDYSMVEISQIVESNGANILSMYVSSAQDNRSLLEVTLKINKTELKDIIATFERYEYNIKAAFQESEYLDDLKERLDSFLHYLDL